MRSWSDYARLPPEGRAKVLPLIRAWIEAAEGISALDVYRGTARVFEISAASNLACAAFDYVMSPTSPVAGFPAEWPCPANDVTRAIHHIGFTVAFNMSEQPAISVTVAKTETGMPIGLQIAGRRFEDLGVLRMARVGADAARAARLAAGVRVTAGAGGFRRQMGVNRRGLGNPIAPAIA